MDCRVGCAACCIVPSISSPIPGLPQGKPAGVRCAQLTDDNRCQLFGQPNRPTVCISLRPSVEMCGTSNEQAILEVQQLKAENAQLNQHLRSLEAIDRRAKAYQEHIDQQKQQIDHLQQELADARADLEVARSHAARPASPGSAVIIEMSDIVEPMPRTRPAQTGSVAQASLWSDSSTVVPELVVQPSPTASPLTMPDWYSTWQQATSPEAWTRQQKLIEVVGDGEAFFRAEIVAVLNAAGLLTDDPDRPGGTAQRLFTRLLERGLIEEIDGGYGASVARPLMLTEQGREAYREMTGRALPDSLYQRLLNRHKTVEHTVLNLMAHQVLRRFRYTAIDLFPEPRRTPAGALVIPDLTAVSSEGGTLLIECERLAKHRTAAERRNKWGDLAALTNSHFHVVVAGGQQQTALITELSTWLHETGTKRVQLSVCQYVKAVRPNATTPWTYTTAWALT